jgi:hypothetical protein
MAPEEEIQTATAAAPPNPPADDAEPSRGRGRPTLAELDARKAEIEAREAELAQREAELELQAAEANLAQREIDLERRGLALAAAGRTTARTGSIRSEDVTETVRGRRYKGGADMPNKFHIPKEQIPVGASYQWNNHSVFGQEQHSYSAFMAMQGWEPVPASRHPHLVPAGYDGPIIIDGQILVERPIELTNEALQEDYDKARGEVRLKEEQLYGTPQGQLPRARANGSNEFNQVSKRVEAPEAELPRSYQYENTGGGAVIE